MYAILSDYKPRANCAWFFPSPTGKRWDTDNFSQDLRKINVEHELDWSCQHFRHTLGSHLAQKGESLYKIAQLMGNSPAICRKHYAALIPEEMQDTVEFKKRQVREPENDAELKMLMKRLLGKLDDGDNEARPLLRLVRGDSC